LVSTPLLAFAARFNQAALGIMITASHNPSEFNGFKFFPNGEPASPDWMRQFYGLLSARSFRKGAGVVEKKDFSADYRYALVNRIAKNFQELKVVLDPGNGMNCLGTVGILESLNCKVFCLNASLDGRFPGRGADSSKPEALEVLGEKVRKSKAALGAAFDGDADRVSFVDEKGRTVPNEMVLCLFAKKFAPKSRRPRVVFDTKCSDWVEKILDAEGIVPLLEKAGHSFIYDRMKRDKALLAGEASGHFFLPGGFPGDALFACLSLMTILKEQEQPFSRLIQDFPQRVSTHDIRLPIEEQAADAFLESLRQRAQEMGASVSTVDGVRAVFEGGWGIVRRSVTQSKVAIRLEASTRQRIVELAEQWLKDYPDLRSHVLKGAK
jgi:phosphomannomutase/phosphoglucomutase